MRLRSRLDYVYAVGRVRALERGLMQSSMFREATEEKDFSSALKVIFDRGSFSKDWSDIKEISELDEILKYEEVQLNKTVFELMLDEEFLKIIELIDRPQEALLSAEKSGNMFMTGYIRHSIDLGNLKTFLRCKYLGQHADSLKDRLQEGGYIEGKVFIDNYELSFSEFREKLHVSPYKDLWEEVTDALAEKDTFIVMERGFEDFLMDYLHRARYIVFGPEPVFAFALARKRELRLIRLVATGKVNQIPTGMIKERISETYV